MENFLKITPAMIEKLTQYWQQLAGDQKIESEYRGGSFYAYTTELGALRIYAKYHESDKKILLRYIKNLNLWSVQFQDLDAAFKRTE